MSPVEAALGIAAGFTAGVLSGLFGVGGGIVATPAISAIFASAPIVAVATPLPVILPTALVGAETYRRAGEIDLRAAAWMSVPGAGASAAGAALTTVVNGHLLLIVTAILLAWQSVQVARGAKVREGARRDRGMGSAWWAFAGIGIAAGLVSGLLGIGGGLIMVPLMVGTLGMPLKRALGTSLAAIVVLVIPGILVHWALDNIDWAIALVFVIGSVAGARVGARIALGTRERTLRLAVAGFLGIVALAYGVSEFVILAREGFSQ